MCATIRIAVLIKGGLSDVRRVLVGHELENMRLLFLRATGVRLSS